MSDPRTFYSEQVGAAVAGDYEKARWGTSPLKAAQYEMTKAAITRHALPLLAPAEKILEVGPGPGTWTKLILATNPNASMTLVDLSPDMLAMARSALGTEKRVSFIQGDFLTVPIEGQYSGFFSSRAIEYFDYRAATRRIASLLAPGAAGAIITKTPKPFFDRLRGRRSDLHTGQMSPAQLAGALQAAGLAVQKVRIATATVPGIGSPALNTFVFELLSNVPLPLLWLLSESYLVTFRKPA